MLAFDAIARVGPGGYFMKDIHTLKHFKKEVLLPKIAMRSSGPDAREEPMRLAARDEVRRILREHRPMELDKSVKQEVLEILKQSDVELHGKPVSTSYLGRLQK
jgi:trimethylamine--corrinoid protein Co-methyltransferase